MPDRITLHLPIKGILFRKLAGQFNEQQLQAWQAICQQFIPREAGG